MTTSDDAEQVHIVGDDPVCKSCGNFGHRSHRDHRCPDHHCAHCRKQGHSKRFCPDVQCPHCDLFGHVNKVDCKYEHCIDVDVDWLNILLQFKRPWQRPRPTQSPQIEVPKHISHKRGPQPKPAAWAAADRDCHRDDARTVAPHNSSDANRRAGRRVYTGPVSKRWYTPARTHGELAQL